MPVNDAALRLRRQRALETLRATTGGQLARVWSGLGGYTPTDQTTWERRAAPIVTAGQNRGIDTQVAYLSAFVGKVTFDRDEVLALCAVDLRIPFISLAKAISGGQSYEAAVEAGGARAEGLGGTGVTWAARAANTAVEGHGRIVGWERIPSGNACEFCVQAAQQVYKTVDSASFGHAKAPCHCDVGPVFAGS